MIIFTESKLAKKPIEKIVLECIKKYKPNAIYLREKEISNAEYIHLALKIMPICESFGVDFFVCHRVNVAKSLGVKNLHTNLNILSKIDAKSDFDKISVSIHSPKEVKVAESLGATNLVFGHIFDTKCKENLPPKGTLKLKEICDITSIPVVAIGGINQDNYNAVLEAQASDFAIMSSAMDLSF